MGVGCSEKISKEQFFLSRFETFERGYKAGNQSHNALGYTGMRGRVRPYPESHKTIFMGLLCPH